MAQKMPQFSMIFAAHDEPAAMAEYARIAWGETIAELKDQGA